MTQVHPSDKDGVCLRQIAYDWDEEDITSPTYEEDNFILRKHLMRCHLGFFIIGILLQAISIIVTTIGCWCLWMTASNFLHEV